MPVFFPCFTFTNMTSEWLPLEIMLILFTLLIFLINFKLYNYIKIHGARFSLPSLCLNPSVFQTTVSIAFFKEGFYNVSFLEMSSRNHWVAYLLWTLDNSRFPMTTTTTTTTFLNLGTTDMLGKIHLLWGLSCAMPDASQSPLACPH